MRGTTGWEAMLRAEGIELVALDAEESTTSCDLIVVDYLEWPPLPRPIQSLYRRGDIGVIQIGHAGGDVVLPRDCTDRELCLACRMLFEIVRLRRTLRQHRGRRRELHRLAHFDQVSHLPNRRMGHGADGACRSDHRQDCRECRTVVDACHL